MIALPKKITKTNPITYTFKIYLIYTISYMKKKYKNKYTKHWLNLGKYEWLAKKYYNRQFAQLLPYQKDKVITWVTNFSPDQGKHRNQFIKSNIN